MILSCSLESAVYAQVIGSPSPVSPANGSSGLPTSVALSWSSVTLATSYEVQVSTSSSFSSILADQTQGGTSYTVSGLTQGTTYYWRVRAESLVLTSSWSSTWSFSTAPGVSPPATPVLVSPANGATGVGNPVTLTWNGSSGATSYSLQIATDANFTSIVTAPSGITATSQQVSGLSSGTMYYWRVEAVNSAGTSSWSGAWSFTTASSVPPPSAPTLSSPVNGATNQPTTLVLSWNASSGATHYWLQVATDQAFSSIVVGDSTITGTSQQVNNLSPSTTYYWRVRALNGAGMSSWSAVWSFVTTTSQIQPPGTPTLVAPANGSTVSGTTATFQWDSVATADHYFLQVATDQAFTKIVYANYSVVGTSQQDTGLAPSTTYYWQVRAVNAGGQGNWSATWSFTTSPPPQNPPSAPMLIAPTDGAANEPDSITFVWHSATAAASYRLQIGESASFSKVDYDHNNIIDTSQLVSGLASGGSYFWRVQASNNAGTSAWSSTSRFTTAAAVVVPPPPILLSPANGSTGQPLTDTLWWGASQGASTYRVQLSQTSAFTTTIIDDSGITKLYAVASALANGATYYWRVLAANSAGNSAWAGPWSFTTMSAAGPPQTPVLLAPPNAATNTPTTDTLRWAPSQNAATYHVQVSSASNFSTTVLNDSGVTQPFAVVAGLADGTAYYWRVQAVNSTGGSGWTSPWHFTTMAASSPPTAPALLAPANGSSDQPTIDTLRWIPISNADSYDVAISTYPSLDSTVVRDSVTTVPFEVVGPLRNSVAYYWRVRGKNSVGLGAWSERWSLTIVTPASVPPVPTLVSPSNGATNLPTTDTLRWMPSQTAYSYVVQISKVSNFATTVLNDTGIARSFLVDTGLAGGTVYYWRVAAINTVGESGWGGPWSFTTGTQSAQLTSPALQYPPDGSVNQPLSDTLKWSQVQGAQTYTLEIAPTAAFDTSAMIIATDTAASGFTTLLSASTAYWWRVRAQNQAGESNWSEVWKFTTVAPPTTAPTLLSPVDGAKNVPTTATCFWNTDSGASIYHLQVASDSLFTSLVVNDSTIVITSASVDSLGLGTTYFWRVRAGVGGGGWSVFSPTWRFTTSFQELLAGYTAVAFEINYPFSSNTSPLKPSDYRLVGLPGSSSIPLTALMKGSPGSAWEAYWDNGASTNYLVKFQPGVNDSLFGFTLGRAFWIIKNGPLVVDTIVPNALLDTTGCADIQLHSGWNLITDPFPETVAWEVLQRANGIGDSLFGFYGAFQISSELVPGYGFYFFNTQGLPVLRVPQPGSLLAQRSVDARISSAQSDAWTVRIVTESEGLKDNATWFGVSSNVQSQYNRYDVHKPGGMGLAVNSYFAHADWDNKYNLFASEIHPEFSNLSQWTLTVEATPFHKATLHFVGLDQIPAGFVAFLHNPVDGTWNDLRANPTQSFIPAARQSQFEIVVGRSDSVERQISGDAPSDWTVRQNYPNPFNLSTIIPVNVQMTTEVDIGIYNILGQKITDLYRGPLTAGVHQFVWNAQDMEGRIVPSGVYFYRVAMHPGTTLVRKMLLMK